MDLLLALGEQKYAEEHPLHHAATKDDATLFRRLLQKPELRADIDGDPGSGHDCLQTAIFNGNKEIAEALVTLPLSEFDWTRELSICVTFKIEVLNLSRSSHGSSWSHQLPSLRCYTRPLRHLQDHGRHRECGHFRRRLPW